MNKSPSVSSSHRLRGGSRGETGVGFCCFAQEIKTVPRLKKAKKTTKKKKSWRTPKKMQGYFEKKKSQDNGFDREDSHKNL